ncbi:hypothetical protein [Acetobacter sicerae]|uniref:hypothetical protein n=1 Tax=Acetobacter sicerae TaxID=85325 RepID=UPI00156B7953|nr:hypothetical protein [Acetobacter sicerae]NHN90442.1 hypothetical protein [Acetobacter sicerae]
MPALRMQDAERLARRACGARRPAFITCRPRPPRATADERHLTSSLVKKITIFPEYRSSSTARTVA